MLKFNKSEKSRSQKSVVKFETTIAPIEKKKNPPTLIESHNPNKTSLRREKRLSVIDTLPITATEPFIKPIAPITPITTATDECLIKIKDIQVIQDIQDIKKGGNSKNPLNLRRKSTDKKNKKKLNKSNKPNKLNKSNKPNKPNKPNKFSDSRKSLKISRNIDQEIEIKPVEIQLEETKQAEISPLSMAANLEEAMQYLKDEDFNQFLRTKYAFDEIWAEDFGRCFESEKNPILPIYKMREEVMRFEANDWGTLKLDLDQRAYERGMLNTAREAFAHIVNMELPTEAMNMVVNAFSLVSNSKVFKEEMRHSRQLEVLKIVVSAAHFYLITTVTVGNINKSIEKTNRHYINTYIQRAFSRNTVKVEGIAAEVTDQEKTAAAKYDRDLLELLCNMTDINLAALEAAVRAEVETEVEVGVHN